VTPEVVKAKIVVKKQSATTLSGLPIKIEGLSENYKADITNGSIDLFIDGPSSIIKNLNPNDFNAFIDVTKLKEGAHKVEIQVEGPPNVNWELDHSTANVTIAKNNA
jgi:YbbR domain-containing protein